MINTTTVTHSASSWLAALLISGSAFLLPLHAAFGQDGHQYPDEHPGETRVRIAPAVAEQAGIRSALAGPGTIRQMIKLYGKTAADPNRLSHIRARYPGLISSVAVDIGERVQAGQTLATIESNQSLEPYAVKAPFAGLIIERHANGGEMAQEQVLFTLANFERLWAELRVFPGQKPRLEQGQPIAISTDELTTASVIVHLLPGEGVPGKGASGEATTPFLIARAAIDNREGRWYPGLMIEAEVTVAERDVALVVANRALQQLRGATVVFVQSGDSYEARHLELGRSDGKYTEVLGGLAAGERYVIKNSYLIKADIEKSAAAHHH